MAPEDKDSGKLLSKSSRRNKLIVIIIGILAIFVVSMVFSFALNRGFNETNKLPENCYSINSKWVCPTPQG